MRRSILILGLSLVLGGCGGDSPAVDTPPGPPAATTAAEAEPEWRATLQPGSDHPQVRGTATAESRQGLTVVSMELTGGQPGASHPWHVHLGACGTHGDYFGEPETYPPLHLDDQGRGTASAPVQAELQPGQEYHVNVHGADDHDQTVACGELRRS